MELFAGNQSEKPYLPKVIQDVKASMKSDSKIIEVADKGLNCVKNIVTALARKDGYIFSKSIKTAKENEFDWIFDENGWTEHYDSNGKFIYSTKSKLVREYINRENTKLLHAAASQNKNGCTHWICTKNRLPSTVIAA